MDEFTDKVVVITGGNSGIGLSIAKKFDEKGAKVAFIARNEKKNRLATAQLKNAFAFQGDVRKIEDLNQFYEEVHSHFGKIDILIANAAVGKRRAIDLVDEAYFDEIVDTNFKGVYFTVQRAISYLNPGAAIVLISSLAAHIGPANYAIYSATKAAVSYLARALSADLLDRKIRVNAISPGYVETPRFTLFDENERKRIAAGIPLKRVAKPEEIAEAALYLASIRSSYIVGADLIVDGGVSALFRESI